MKVFVEDYYFIVYTRLFKFSGFPHGSGEGNGNSLQYSCLENSMDGGTLQATVHGVAKSQTQLSD